MWGKISENALVYECKKNYRTVLIKRLFKRNTSLLFRKGSIWKMADPIPGREITLQNYENGEGGLWISISEKTFKKYFKKVSGGGQPENQPIEGQNRGQKEITIFFKGSVIKNEDELEKLQLATAHLDQYCIIVGCLNCCIREICAARGKNITLADQIRWLANAEQPEQ